MDTNQLKEFLKKNNLKKIHVGVCAIDRLPNISKCKKAHAFCVNLSRAGDGVGSHWIGIFIDTKYNLYYLDSYGFKEKSYFLTDFIGKYGKKVFYNKRQLQPLTSNTCGMYVASFLIHMMRGGSLKGFLSKFSKNLIINDIFVRKNYNYFLRK